MNVYKLLRSNPPDVFKPGEYQGALVVAKSEEEARFIHPNGKDRWNLESKINYWGRGWISPLQVSVQFYEATQGARPRVLESWLTEV